MAGTRTSFITPSFLTSIAMGNRLFLGTTKGNIYCLSRTNRGNTIWQQKIENGIYSTPAIYEKKGLLYLGDDKGIVYALLIKDGSINWQEKISKKRIRAGLLIYGRALYVGSESGILYALKN